MLAGIAIMRLQSVRLSWCIVGFSVALSSCMMGPNFHPPKAPETTSYTESPQPVKTVHIRHAGNAGKSQQFVVGQDIPAAWWELFHSQAINDLVQLGLNNSPNLASAKATLTQAKENVNAQVGSTLFPQVTASLGGQRERFNAAALGGGGSSSIFNLYNATVNVSYTLDVFGSARRGIESLAATVDYERFELDAAYLTLTSNIVTTAVTVASLEAQVKATQDIIRYQQDELTILGKQFKLGGIAGADVLTQEAQVAQTRATLPPLEQSLVQARHALAVLVGSLPGDFQMAPINLDKLVLPARLPVSLPSELVRQRPDIQASEALLHAANAQVGVATANLFPQFTLSGSYGWQSTVPSNLFKSGTNLWSWGGSLLQPIFEGGSLRAKRRGAIAAFEFAEAQYRQTVLQAFQNVADTLRALEHDAEALKAQKDAEISARKSLNITQQQFRLGGVNYISLLTAERSYQVALISRIQAQAARYADTAALFQALGGGWWNVNSTQAVS
jgi:NodT family efflux transporter outer membrane factor (OMF) lipoprotein